MGKYNSDRGNTPAGVSEKEFIKAYNAEDSAYDKVGRDAALGARKCGLIRDLTIDRLIRKGVLTYDFVDDNI